MVEGKQEEHGSDRLAEEKRPNKSRIGFFLDNYHQTLTVSPFC